jgi:hypothetical protein
MLTVFIFLTFIVIAYFGNKLIGRLEPRNSPKFESNKNATLTFSGESYMKPENIIKKKSTLKLEKR